MLEKLYMFSQTRFHSVPAIVSKTYIVFKRQNIKRKYKTFLGHALALLSLSPRKQIYFLNKAK